MPAAAVRSELLLISIDDDTEKPLRGMKSLAKFLTGVCCSACLTACGNSGGNAAPNNSPPPPPPPAADATPGGIWAGVDTGGVDIIALVTESGRFQYVNEFFDQGTGNLAVSSGNAISSSFQLVTALGATFDDGTTLADCTLSGTLVERQSMEISTDCTTTAGHQTQSTATLTYNALYERDSALTVIAGNYDDDGLVLNIDSNGVIFEQDPSSGCITDGQISVIDPDYNAYDVEFGFSNCSGPNAILNGTNFVGMATLDNTVVPETLIIAATGEVSDVQAALFGITQRL